MTVSDRVMTEIKQNSKVGRQALSEKVTLKKYIHSCIYIFGAYMVHLRGSKFQKRLKSYQQESKLQRWED
jgi:hypothetical protein